MGKREAPRRRIVTQLRRKIHKRVKQIVWVRSLVRFQRVLAGTHLQSADHRCHLMRGRREQRREITNVINTDELKKDFEHANVNELVRGFSLRLCVPSGKRFTGEGNVKSFLGSHKVVNAGIRCDRGSSV